MKKVLLYSGGMDSWLIDKLWKPDVKLFFNIGTGNNSQELRKVSQRNDVIIIDLPLHEFEQPDNNFFLPLRNLHFVCYAAHYGDVICLGATGSSTHKDKNETFATLSENVLNYLLSEDKMTEAPVKIVMPYRDVTKTELLRMFIEQGGNIEECYKESFSCYSPNSDGTPCMMCTSCASKFTAFYNNGYHFDEDTQNKFVQSVLSNPYSKGQPLELAKKLSGRFDKRICIDFDNTITQPSKYPITGQFDESCVSHLNKLVHDGYELIMFTSRTGNDLDEAIKICKEHNLPFSDYIGGKPLACGYIDDKNMSIPWRK